MYAWQVVARVCARVRACARSSRRPCCQRETENRWLQGETISLRGPAPCTALLCLLTTHPHEPAGQGRCLFTFADRVPAHLIFDVNGFGIKQRSQYRVRDRTSLNTLCIENHRACSSVFIKRTRQLNLNSSKGIIHLKFNPYMRLSTDTTKGNVILTLLNCYV